MESIIARLGLDVSEFKKGLYESAAVAAESTAKMNDTLEGLKEGLAAGAVGEFANHILENAEAIEHQSKALTIGTDQLQAFQFATREAGGSNEEATKVLQTTKLKLDELAANTPAAVEAFRALGLSADDFIGLSLDQSLEKIARAYDQNSTAAGAYTGLQQITGRAGKELTDVLVNLGERGFGSLVDHARDAHAIISGSTISDLAAAKNEFDQLKNELLVGGSEIFGALDKVMQLTGAAAGATFSNIERSAGAWEKVKSVVKSIVEFGDPLTGLSAAAASLASTTAEKSGETKANSEATATALRMSNQLLELNAKFEETIAKATREGLDDSTKLALIRQQIAEHYAAAAAAGSDEVRMQTEMNRAAELGLEARKLVLDMHDKEIAAELKHLESGREQLTLVQQLAVLEKERSIIAADIAVKAAQHRDITKDQNTLEEINSKLSATTLKLKEQELTYAADLVSSDKVKVESAKIYFELITKQTSPLAIQAETEQLLARSAGQLSDAESSRLQALISMLTPQQKQQEVLGIISNGTAALTALDRDRLAFLTGQTAQLDAQVAKINQQAAAVRGLAAAWDGFSFSSGAGASLSSTSTDALQGEAARLQRQITKDRIAQGENSPSNNISVAFDMAAAQQQLEAVQAEIVRRENTVDYLKANGESATRMAYGDAAANQALTEMQQANKQTNVQLTTLNSAVNDINRLLRGS